MSVVGLDLGNKNCVVAVARKRGIDILANEASRRETASYIGFKDDQRSMGEHASTQLTSNFKNTIMNFKRLIGRKYNDKETQDELKVACYSSKESKDDGNILFEVDYNGSMKEFTPEQITAMMITQMRKIVENDSNGTIKMQELVISVPYYFNDYQKRALRDAASIAQVNCVQLLSEPLAVSIPWGMYKKDLPEEDKPLYVMFVNFGESSLWSSIFSVSKTKINVLSHSCDVNLGGRDFDNILVNHFASIIKEKYKLDVLTNKRAILRLKSQCEKVKKVLSTGPEAPLYVESIMNDIDVSSSIKRSEFTELVSPLIERAKIVFKNCLDSANITNPLDIVEVVGGSSYLPQFQDALQEITKVNQLSHTLNKSESVARGCALQCAVVSPQFHINKATIFKDYNPYTIRITWNEYTNENEEKTKSAVLFPKGCSFNLAKRVTFQKSNYDIEISADYDKIDEFPYSMNTLHIGSFKIPKFTTTLENPDKPPIIEVMFKLDSSGIFILKHAKAIETYTEIIKTPKKQEEKSNKEDDKKNENENDKEKLDKDGDIEMEEIKKERKKTSDLQVSCSYVGGLSKHILEKYKQEEINMQNADELAISTAYAKNALESYSYDAQSKLSYDFSEWSEFATEDEKTKLLSLVDEVLAWLYGEGESATKEEYQNKLSELQVIGSPIELRKNENETRDLAIETLKKAFIYYRAFVDSIDEKYSHISPEERQKVTDKVNETEEWLTKMEEKQNALAKNLTPVLLTSEIEKRKDSLTIFCNTIVNTPKPKPKPKTETPKKESESESETENKNNNNDDAMQTDDTSQSSEQKDNIKTEENKKEEESNVKPAEDGKIEVIDDNLPTPPEPTDMDVD